MSYDFVARQPIFDKNRQVFGYELLFRSSAQNSEYDSVDGDQATLQVLENSLLGIGINKLTNGRPAFINFPANTLLAPFVGNLPKQIVVIEVLETVRPSEDIIAQCKKLKANGFRLALDDFSSASFNADFIPYMDYIKVDFRATNRKERRELIRQYKTANLVFLAEKVETYAEFEEAVHDGYMLLQGYFFSKPEVLNTRSLRIIKQTAIDFMHELMLEDINYDRLEGILRHDVSLAYKILRFINSSYFGFNTKITSIRQTLTLLGKEELYKWSSLFTLSNLALNKPSELLVFSLIRTRFAELIAKQLQQKNANEFFLVGMFSLMDAFLDSPLENILKDLPISEEVKTGILGGNNLMGDVLRLVIACERGDWDECSWLIDQLHLSKQRLANEYYQAQQWSHIDSIRAEL